MIGRLFFSAALSLCAATVEAAAPNLIVATGPVAGFAFPLGGELCRIYEQAAPGRRCAVSPTSGSVEDLERLRSGDIDLALVQSDRAADAVAANGAFAGKPPFSDLRSIAGFYSDALTIVVRAAGPVQSVDDLKGKRVIVGEPGAPDALFNDWLEGLGWTKADLGGVVEMNRDDQITALCGAKVAAIAVTAAHPNRFVRDALAACPTRLLDLAGPGLDTTVNAHRAYAPAIIDLTAYGKTGQTAHSFGPKTVLVTTAKLPDETVLQVLSSLVAQVNALRSAHPAFTGFDRSTLAGGTGLGAERHAAAVKYLTDNKLMDAPSGD